MKKIIVGFVSLALLLSFANSAYAKTVSVKGYYKANGTYVAPIKRTSPNNSKLDNYSTKGNYNPYSGKTGTKVVH